MRWSSGRQCEIDYLSQDEDFFPADGRVCLSHVLRAHGFWGFIYLFTCLLIYKLIILEQQMATFDWKKVPLQAEVSR